ncbi:maleate cis-trans isomerase family protein [Agrobacterium rosae]|uniref:Aspartate/glutamate racemase family protein n=1 Tax=Agrobacterium rosae TaxID=1972867 RepID=A0AAE5VMK1_9HYPH|nr:aspartate/glutamate racemase family protein [Agrobacterium rosae]KAA3511636.1 maleate cis-trans isomerase [Agrobacterium rosae]KAA3518940.1 maleate cis-trans isomerase [Agrobacterium rosae]MCM2435185.1 maleate cis-trans isomerase [Agrobacterium rosae]MDX8331080.1 aspartate/glutamate racemase family protein [Agrobacterium rosae]MQB49334.1 maleate cis-trans isomerase [Agrobacterium rosae]
MLERHKSVYSYRAKLGLITPPTNTVNEAEWARMMPEGVTFHTHRMPLHADTKSESGKAALMHDLEQVFAMLKNARVDAIAYACTAGSMINPVEALPEMLTQTMDVPAVTTSAAIIKALKTLGVTRLSVATPYADTLNEHETHFLQNNRFSVERLIGLGIGKNGPSDYIRIAETPVDTVASHVRAAFVPGSEAILITCTDFPSLPLISELEREFGVPVITSNQATFWAMLRIAGIEDRFEDYGRLLAEH